MAVLSDIHMGELIKTQKMITPYLEELQQPASYDLRLGDSIIVDQKHTKHLPYILNPLEFVLGSTIETLNIPLDLAAKFEGKSSLGRMGVMTHVTAGFIDPGFCGELTLEIFNVSSQTFLLRPGMRIGQIMFMELTSPVSRSYAEKGHYQGQVGPTRANAESYLS